MPVRSMVCSGLMRPSAGYLLFAPCGPWLSKLSASEITLPLRTRRAAATMSAAGCGSACRSRHSGPSAPSSCTSRRPCEDRLSLRSVMVWRSARGKRIAYQAAALGGAVLVAWFLISNTMTNLEERRIASGFGFLGREAGFEIGESAFLRYGASDSYLRALFVGLTNTLAVAAIGVVLATFLGTAVGLARCRRNFLLRTLSAAYVELARNVPLLVQLFFWYAVITEGMPHARERSAAARGVPVEPRHLLPHALERAGTAGTTSPAARRSRRSSRRCSSSGSRSTPRVSSPRSCAPGSWPWTAGRSRRRMLGLSRPHTTRLVVLPQALRVIVPPMTSQYLNLTKNSSLAVAIGYPDLVSIANTTMNQTGQAIEGIASSWRCT